MQSEALPAAYRESVQALLTQALLTFVLLAERRGDLIVHAYESDAELDVSVARAAIPEA